MAAPHNQLPTSADGQSADSRVTTIISCPGVRAMARAELRSESGVNANENQWFDVQGFKRRWYANFAAAALVVGMLFGGVWIVGEFVRLQKLEACFEAGRRDCLPLDMNHRHNHQPRN